MKDSDNSRTHSKSESQLQNFLFKQILECFFFKRIPGELVRSASCHGLNKSICKPALHPRNKKNNTNLDGAKTFCLLSTEASQSCSLSLKRFGSSSFSLQCSCEHFGSNMVQLHHRTAKLHHVAKHISSTRNDHLTK